VLTITINVCKIAVLWHMAWLLWPRWGINISEINVTVVIATAGGAGVDWCGAAGWI
jgi:hypothetical protein